jgi:trans-aconitate 2-methyltransferase
MTWDPDVYESFADHRMRPGIELLQRIPDIDPRLVVDLGCGTGRLTVMLARRWPAARVHGVDSSGAMLDRAEGAAVTWVEADIHGWEPDAPVDLVYSNAALHWLDDHPELFRRLAGHVAPGGVLAVQMPDNWREPSHRIPAAVLDEGEFPQAARGALLRDPVARLEDYRRWIGEGFRFDLWTTTYLQILEGTDPVLQWVMGTVLRPVLAVLSPPERDRFLEGCARAYRTAYPPGTDGSTVLPFRRMFIVARRD